MKIALLYASIKGSTAEIAKRVAYTMRELNRPVELINTAEHKTLDQAYDAIILITPIYKGLWVPAMTKFVRDNSQQMQDTPIWCLFPCIRVLEKSGTQYAYANYIPEHITDHLQVMDVRFIAGKLMRSDITFDDLTTLNERYDGEMLNRIAGDYRDWGEILAWVHGIVAQFKQLAQQPANSIKETIII